MIESENVRVNVTSATSTPRYTEYGERIGEIEMQLPSNLVHAQNVQSAEMAVMKMRVPMSEIPSCRLPITSYDHRSQTVTTSAWVMVAPINGIYYGNTIVWYDGHDHPFFKRNRELTPEYIQVSAKHVNYQLYDQEEYRDYLNGNYEFDNISSLLERINKALSINMGTNSLLRETAEQCTHPRFAFKVNSDNTISVEYTTRPGDNVPILYQGDIASNEFDAVDRIPCCNYVDGTVTVPKEAFPFVICCNEDLYRKLRTLPWTKVRNTQFNALPDSYFYVLRTDHANFKCLTPDYISVGMEGSRNIYRGTTFEFNFVESDAVSLVDLSAIVLTMQGAEFNQQVLPINIPSGQTRQAQTTNVPVVEMFYPLIQRPSDLTTDMLISQTDFSNAAPIRINPSLLKERSIKFKLYYLTSEGELIQMKIPPTAAFTIQIVFHLTYYR
ncbi:MAG: hypothetical protein J5767_14130 [Paludibacteraceae bacterium]|nr:hypothetical protein [Paludibacteraceae bacterium]